MATENTKGLATLMKVFLLGATGVLGRSVVARLLARGDEVVALVRSIERAAPVVGPHVQVFEGDILRGPPERLQRMLVGCDAAAHLATALRADSPGLGTTNTNAMLRTEGSRRLLDAVLAAGVGRYIQQSIALSYVDGGEAWLDEETPFFNADDPSGASRPVVEMEAMVRAVDPERVACVILRGGAFVGPDTRQDQTISSLKDGSMRVPGDGSNWISFVHVDDYAEAVVKAIHSAASGVILNITDEPIRNREYVERLAAMLGLAAPLHDQSLPLPRSYRCSYAAAKDVLGWQPSRGIWPEKRP